MTHLLLINGLFLFFLGCLSLWHSKSDLEKRFFMMSIGTSIWNISAYAINLSPESDYINTLSHLQHISALFFIIMAYEFTRKLAQIKTTAISAMFFGIFSLFSALIILNKITKLSVIESKLVYTDYTGYTLYATFIIGICLFIFYNLYISLKNKDTKAQGMTLLTGIIGMFVVSVLFNLILPILGRYKYLVLGYLGSTFLSLSFAFAITKQELLDIKVIITRFVAYLIVLALIATTFLYANLYLTHSFLVIGVNVVLGTLWAIFFRPLILFVQTPLQKKFLKGYYNKDEILHKLSSKLLYAHDFSTVMRIISSEFLEQLELKSAFIISRSEFENSYEIQKITLNIVLERLESDHPLIRFFFSASGPILYRDMPNEVTKTLAHFEFESESLLFAVHSTNLLQGIFVLNPKLSELAFDASDIRLLTTLTNQILVVFDRIAKDHQLKDALKQLNALNENLRRKDAEQVKELKEKEKTDQDLKLAKSV